MHLQLEKGGKFALNKGIDQVRVSLSWAAPEVVGGEKYDPDASAFGLVHLADGTPVAYNDGSHFVFYGDTDLKQADGHFETADGSISHSGDNQVGGEERITITLSKIPTALAEIAIWVTIYQAKIRKHTFGAMKDAEISITDLGTGNKLAQYKLGPEFKDFFAVQVGSLYRNASGVWEFTAIGAGAMVEIEQVLSQYGIQVSAAQGS